MVSLLPPFVHCLGGRMVYGHGRGNKQERNIPRQFYKTVELIVMMCANYFRL